MIAIDHVPGVVCRDGELGLCVGRVFESGAVIVGFARQPTDALTVAILRAMGRRLRLGAPRLEGRRTSC